MQNNQLKKSSVPTIFRNVLPQQEGKSSKIATAYFSAVFENSEEIVAEAATLKPTHNTPKKVNVLDMPCTSKCTPTVFFENAQMYVEPVNIDQISLETVDGVMQPENPLITETTDDQTQESIEYDEPVSPTEYTEDTETPAEVARHPSESENVTNVHVEYINEEEQEMFDYPSGDEFNCRTCLNIVDETTCTRITEICLLDTTVKEIILQLVPNMVSTLDDDEVVCNDCLIILESSIKFIAKCLEVEAILKEEKYNLDTTDDVKDSSLVEEIKSESDIEPEENITENIGIEHDYHNKNESTDKSIIDNANMNEAVSVINYLTNDDAGENSIEIEYDSLPPTDGMLRKSLDDQYKHKINKRLVKVKDGEIFSCTSCAAIFTSKQDYESHVQTHPPHICDLCGKEFGKKESLRAHRYTHKDPNSFICEVCGKGFKDINSLRGHQKTHESDELYMCDKCTKVFKTERLLHIHMKNTHDKFYRYQCSHCGMWSKNQSNLENHIRLVHLKEKPYQCNVCQKKFGRRDYLNNHIATNCGTDPKPGPNRKTSRRVIDRQRRTKVIVNDDDELYPCKVCGKVIKDKVRLERHLHIHINRHRCRYCPQTFIAKCRRNQHELEHQNEPVYFRCNVCYRKYSTKEELEAHAATQVHRRPPRYSCGICGQKFHRRFSLSQHNLTDHVGMPQEYGVLDEIVYENLLENEEELKTV